MTQYDTSTWTEPVISPQSLEESVARMMGEPDALETAALEAQAALEGTDIPPEAPEAEPLAPALSAERLAQLEALDAWLAQNQDKAAALLNAQAQVEPPAPVSEPPAAPAAVSSQPPPGLDLDDPNIAWLYNKQLESENALKALMEQQRAEQIRQGRIGVEQGIEAFTAGHPELSAEQVERIKRAPATDSLFMSYATQGYSAREATEKALNDAMWTDASVRAAVTAQQSSAAQTQAATDARRQNLWAGVQGGKASAPPPPADVLKMNNKQLTSAVAEEFRTAMNGSPL